LVAASFGGGDGGGGVDGDVECGKEGVKKGPAPVLPARSLLSFCSSLGYAAQLAGH